MLFYKTKGKCNLKENLNKIIFSFQNRNTAVYSNIFILKDFLNLFIDNVSCANLFEPDIIRYLYIYLFLNVLTLTSRA